MCWKYRALGAKMVVIRLESTGCLVLTANATLVQVPPVQSQVVDATGAGNVHIGKTERHHHTVCLTQKISQFPIFHNLIELSIQHRPRLLRSFLSFPLCPFWHRVVADRLTLRRLRL